MTPELVVPVLLVFASLAVATGGLAWVLLDRADPVQRRLREVSGAHVGPVQAPAVELVAGRPTNLDQLEKLLPKSPREMSKLRQRLLAAGYPRPEAAVLYAVFELVLPLALGYVPIHFLGLQQGWMLAAFVGAISFLLPGLWLGQQAAKRKKALRNGLADALDLLLVCVESGSGLDQSISRVAHELQNAYPALSAELSQVVSEMRAGRPRVEALRNFADRTKVDDIRTLVSTLVQTDRFGTSIGPALRTHADVSRTKRRQRAEERAQKLGVKLVFPLVFCLFPAMYVVVLGPVVIQIVRVFFGEFAK